MRLSVLLAATVLALAAVPSHARDKDAPPAKNVVTVYVKKGSPGGLEREINKLHAKMEAEGWSYQDLGVYTEDGDLEGLFVTYVKRTPATP